MINPTSSTECCTIAVSIGFLWFLDLFANLSYQISNAHSFLAKLKFIIPQIGHRRVFEAKPLDLQDILTTYSKEVGPRELLYIWQTASSFFGYLVTQGVISQNLAKFVAKPRQKQTSNDFRYLSRDQVHKFIKVAEANYDPLVDLYYFALSSGMREGEILGLRWNNVDWDTRSIIVVEQVQWTDQKREGKPGY